MNRNIMNLVNFVRGCEPREPEKDLVEPVREELRVNAEFGLPSTVLIQYDALLREDMVELFKSLPAEGPEVEFGLWFEMNRQLTEAAGIPWRGRPGYDWDWFVNPGFLMAYTPEQRECMIDLAFEKFKEVFRYYPGSAGSWLLDAHSMKYMSEKYRMDAFCICREQFAVDAYTLWGGYYTGGYYPSVNNAISPAQTPENQISVPVFRMLGLDPIYGYDEGRYPTGVWGCNTMEPVWTSGSDRRIMNWYFDTYYNSASLNYAHATTGQENSFGWPMIQNGYKLQAELIAALRAEGKLTVETLGETGRNYKAAYALTPATCLTALTDRAENGLKSVWYNSRNYRAGFIAEPEGRVFLRDFMIYDEQYRERYLTEPCESWDARYDVLPVVDTRLRSDLANGIECGLFADGLFSVVSAEAAGDNDLKVTLSPHSDCEKGCKSASASILFCEKCVKFYGFTALKYNPGVLPEGSSVERSADGRMLRFVYREFEYSIKLAAGEITKELVLRPDENGYITIEI